MKHSGRSLLLLFVFYHSIETKTSWVWEQRNPVHLVAVPPALHGCEAIVLDDAPHGTSLDNPTCAFRNKKFEMGVLELVLLQCLKGIWSHAYYLMFGIYDCNIAGIWGWPDGCLLSLFARISVMPSQAAHLSCTFCYQNKAAAMIVPPAMIHRERRYILNL